DPFYLTYKARQYDYHTKLIEMSGEINDAMPEYVVEKLMEALNEKKKCLNGAKIVMLGIAYKNDIEDMRESPALKVLEHLEKRGADVTVVDSWVPQFRWNDGIIKTEKITDELLSSADAVVITTGHTNVDYENVIKKADIVFDTKNITKKLNCDKSNVILL
ncbi:MAG TPA: UDP binding domain-containing protein, partial [Tepiditoga sp.]|nr:UDP binding domain-containing protein [Tepiditoga sp.]